MEWGIRGARDAAARGDIVVIVDVLCFSTTTIVAVHAGMQVIPASLQTDVATLAKTWQAEVAHPRQTAGEGYSLSPTSFLRGTNGNNRLILPSPNGARCSTACRTATAVFIGALINAQPVSRHIQQLSHELDKPVTIIACGEQWNDPISGDNCLRPAIEDYLGAGAILAYIDEELSPEADVCRSAFRGSLKRLDDLIWDCGSGRELRERGFADDVHLARKLNLYSTVPGWVGGVFQNVGADVDPKAF